MGEQGYYFEWKEGRVMKLPAKVFAVVFREEGHEEDSITLSFARDEEDLKENFARETIKEIVELHMPISASERERTSGKPVNNEVNHPKHYCKGGIECIDVIKAATEGLVGMEAVCTANIIKYIFRWKEKNGTTDVMKCEWYVKKLIEELNND
jgi:hypothetical protein